MPIHAGRWFTALAATFALVFPLSVGAQRHRLHTGCTPAATALAEGGSQASAAC